MRYYRVNGAFSFLVATQDQAKREARELKCSWEPHDVPTDKEGLMAYLNSRSGGTDDGVVVLAGTEVPLVESTEETYTHKVETPLPATRYEEASFGSSQLNGSYEATDIEDFILNRASVAQCENIFARLGTRFKELANASLLG